MNLSDGGVSNGVLANRIRRQLLNTVDELLAWQGSRSQAVEKGTNPTAMLALWAAIERRGHVLVSRATRERPGAARGKGLRAYEWDEDLRSLPGDDHDFEGEESYETGESWSPWYIVLSS